MPSRETVEAELARSPVKLRQKFHPQQRVINHCQGGSDGDCFWEHCPQARDNEPHATGRHCPLDWMPDDDC